MRTIAQISDLHFGRHSSGVAEDLLASLQKLNPDLVVISGDLTQRAGHAEFAEARRFLERIPQPKLIVPGNHDMPLYNIVRRFLTPFAKYHHYVSPLGVPADLFVDQEIAVLGLNTARRFTRKSGRVSIEQIALIKRAFADVPPGVFKILVTHHPLGAPDGGAALALAGRARLALETIAETGVHLLLSGHHHRSASGSVDAELVRGGCVLILHAGTAMSTRTRGGEGNSYNLIRVDGGELSIAVMEWHAGCAFRDARAATYRLRGGCWRQDS